MDEGKGNNVKLLFNYIWQACQKHLLDENNCHFKIKEVVDYFLNPLNDCEVVANSWQVQRVIL